MSIVDAADRIEWSECWLTPRPMPAALASEVRRHLGLVPEWMTRVVDVPWIPRSFALMNDPQLAHMPPHLWRLIAFVVSQDQSCRHCYGLTRSMLKLIGYDDDVVERLERDVHLAHLDRADELALDFARKVSKANPGPTPDEIARLRTAGFTGAAIAEIAYAAAINVYGNRIATLLALPSESMVRWADHPLARLARPLAALFLKVRAVNPEPLPQPNDGPCAEVVATLTGAPAARVLRRVIDDAMASPILARRTKLLMLAVIGRALDCEHAEREARTGLASEGFDTSDVDDVLANLGSSK